MVPARKSRRQSKPPAKLQDFVYEDGREKEKGATTPEKKKVEATKQPKKRNLANSETPDKKQMDDSQEPRRSGRTPKLSEKLKSYLNDKGDAKIEVESTAKKQSKKSLTSHGSPTDSIYLKEPQVTLRRLSVSSGVKNLKPHSKSQNLLRNKSPRLPSTPERNVKGNERQVSSKRKKMTKRKLSEMEGIEVIAKSSPTNPQRSVSKTKKTRVSTNGSCERLASESDESLEKDEEEEAQEDEDQEDEGKQEERRSIDSVRQINKDMMTQLLNFGAEIAEAMASSNEKILEVINKENNLHNPLHTFKIEGDDDFDEEEVDKILDWLEKEELQRGAYRKKIIDSMRASHESNMTLFNQLLKKLQSLSSTLRC
ncbi:ESF1 homolog isoform X1 [Penaeus chinensis]|uniref:ESF1 homolog isoform X1 n=2 Tax=Penaeus chinensis TaxID=139456 RepID=UPI001FB57D96|nr:ESF1 homolog isoform X1 [Penaeus chinensis]